MTTDDLNEIYYELSSNYHRKISIKLVEANAEIKALQREDDAYWNGLSDAIAEIKKRMNEDGE